MKIDVCDSGISPDTIKKIDNQSLFKYGWKSNTAIGTEQGHWNYSFTPKSSTWQREVWTSLREIDRADDSTFTESLYYPFWLKAIELFGERRLCRGYVNGYTYGTDAFLHTDVNYKEYPADHGCNMETVMFYLNSEWKLDFGGETVFAKNGEIIKSVIPKQGRVIRFSGNILHGARPISRSCYHLRQVLVFKTVVDQHPTEPAIEFIKELALHIPHSKTTLFDHLYYTYEILKVLEMPRHICLAGLFHSVYDTEFFTAGLSITREDIVNIIGVRAEELVHQFCTLRPRKQAILAEDTPNREALAAIEYANLIEQSERLNINSEYLSAVKPLMEKVNGS